MNKLEDFNKAQRLLRNLFRIGTATAVNLDCGLCRVQTAANETYWLNLLTSSADGSSAVMPRQRVSRF